MRDRYNKVLSLPRRPAGGHNLQPQQDDRREERREHGIAEAVTFSTTVHSPYNHRTVYNLLKMGHPLQVDPIPDGAGQHDEHQQRQGRAAAGAAQASLDEGPLSLSLPDLLYMENPYSYKKSQ